MAQFSRFKVNILPSDMPLGRRGAALRLDDAARRFAIIHHVMCC
jgi:hypothetical protein